MRLYDCINFLINRAQQSVNQVFKDMLSEYDLTPAQYAVLNSLWEQGDMSPGELADAIYIERPAITGILDRLEAKDLIRRVPDSFDRRSINICLTAKAASLKDKILKIVEEAHEYVFKDFSEEQKSELLNMLRMLSTVSTK
ncbi:MAG: MarR family transcriptional regulator [Dehalobacterium sp.]